MSRRDTIIIAVLVNAGLLMVLFATATRSGEKAEKPNKKLELAKQLPVEEEIGRPHKRVELARELPTKEMLGEPAVDTFDEFLASAFTEESEELTLAALPAPEPISQPQAPPLPTASPKENCVKVTVKSGDFLERIARLNNTTVAAIMKTNNLSTTNLRIGQVLTVPVQGKSAPVKSSSEVDYYVVKDGDSPWLIASKNHVRVEDLLRLNGLDEQKARRLRPGDKLKIR